MADLSTNYIDDILAESMNGKRKYRITRADGTFEEVTLEDVSEYEQVGSNFGAGDINKTNQAVNEKFDSGDVVDPMLTTEPGFAADAYQTKLQFDAQNKNLIGFPNYKGRITLTSSNLNNIPKDGFFTYSIRPQNDRVVSITVNGTLIQKFFAKASSNTSDDSTSALIPVKAGDVVSYNNDVNNAGGSIYSSGSYLYPIR